MSTPIEKDCTPTLFELNRALQTVEQLNQHTGSNYTPGLMKLAEQLVAAMIAIAKAQHGN